MYKQLLFTIVAIIVVALSSIECVATTTAAAISPTRAYIPTDADGHKFTARWSKVIGASGYEIDVYSYDSKGTQVYFLQEEPISSSYQYETVTGLDPSVTYYYVIRVKSGRDLSVNSNEVEVIKCLQAIDTPTPLPATDITTNSFTANWNTVDEAIYYKVRMFESTIFTQPTLIDVFKEDFSGVNVGTVQSVEYNGDLNEFTRVPGWEPDLNKCFAAGYYVMYPTFSGSMLTTPVIDLSPCGGAFTLTIRGASGAFGFFYATTDRLYAELLENDAVIETSEVKVIDNKEFTDYSFSFTKGSKTSRLRLVCKASSSYRFYIDEITVSQLFPTGYELIENISLHNSCPGAVQHELTIDAPRYDVSYGYTVSAVGRTVVAPEGEEPKIAEIESTHSSPVYLTLPAGVDEIHADSQLPKAWLLGDSAVAVRGSNIAIYNDAGAMIDRHILPFDTYTFRLGVHGIVIVNVDGTVYKLVL